MMSIWGCIGDLFGSTKYAKDERTECSHVGLIIHVSPRVGHMLAADLRHTLDRMEREERMSNILHVGKGWMRRYIKIFEADANIRRRAARGWSGGYVAVNPELQDEQIRIDYIDGIERVRDVRFSQAAASALFLALAKSQDEINNPKILSAADRFIEVLRTEKLTPAAVIALEGLEDIIRQYAKDMEANK